MYEMRDWKLAVKEAVGEVVSKLTAYTIAIFFVIWVVSGISPWQLLN